MPKAIDLVVLDPAELESRLSEARHELFNLRFQLATGQLDNAARLGQVRRDVARILTVLREREIAEAEGTFVAPTAAQQETARARLAAEDEAVAAAQEAHARAHAHASHELEGEEPEEEEEEPEEEFDEEVPDEAPVAPVAAGAEVDHEEES